MGGAANLPRCWEFLLALGLVALPGPAEAQKKASQGDAIDVSEFKKQLVFLHDGSGHFVAVVPFGNTEQMFYGVGSKVFHQQAVFSYTSDSAARQLELSFWSPAAPGTSTLSLKDGTWRVFCADRETPLVEVSEKERDRILAKAEFKKRLWRRQAYALSRDDDGNYYFVDRLRDEFGGGDFRLFRGRKGKLVQQKMKDVVHDTAGDIFATASGDLRLILEEGKSIWVARRKKKEDRMELKLLPIDDNRTLIYGELGVYSNQRLGTPCDDL